MRDTLLKGGIYLAGRQALGMAISLGSLLVITRLIGPGAYGLFAGALGLLVVVQQISQWGLKVYLLGQAEETDEAYHEAFTLQMGLSVGAAIAAMIAVALLAPWLRLTSWGPIAVVMFAGLPLANAILVPLTQLERRLDFKLVAKAELGSQLGGALSALGGAVAGLGPWSLVVGWWVQQVLMTAWLWPSTGYRPRWRWEPARFRAMVAFGVGFSGSMWLWQLRGLVNPVVVGGLAGAEAVGVVALAVRMVEALSFAKVATWRLSLAALSRLKGDPPGLVKAVSEGMRYQALALGLPLVAFAWSAPWVVPAVFGKAWMPVAAVFPFIAAGCLINAVFNMHSAALYALGASARVAVFHGVHVLLFGGAAAFLVARFGAIGFGWAELAALPSYCVIHRAFAEAAGRPAYAAAAIWLSAYVIPLAAFPHFPWALAALALPLVWPSTREALVADLRLTVGRRRAAG